MKIYKYYGLLIQCNLTIKADICFKYSLFQAIMVEWDIEKILENKERFHFVSHVYRSVDNIRRIF